MQLDLIRLIALDKPGVAAAKVSEKITEVVNRLMLDPGPTKVSTGVLIAL